MPKLRSINKKITPITKYDPDDPGAIQEQIDETKDGDKGHGMFVRKYIKDLDMDFYAGRAVERGKEAIPISMRVPADIVKDVGILIASQKTRFRDRSEFIRTAVYILMNYYAQITEGQFKERVGLRKTEDLIEYEQSESQRVKRIIESFNSQFSDIAKDGDNILHKYLTKVTDSVKNEKRPHIRNKLVKAMTARMEQGGVDPEEYFEDYKGVKE